MWYFIEVIKVACRSAKPLEKQTSDKIAMFCHVKPENV